MHLSNQEQHLTIDTMSSRTQKRSITIYQSQIVPTQTAARRTFMARTVVRTSLQELAANGMGQQALTRMLNAALAAEATRRRHTTVERAQRTSTRCTRPVNNTLPPAQSARCQTHRVRRLQRLQSSPTTSLTMVESGLPIRATGLTFQLAAHQTITSTRSQSGG